MAPLGVMSTVEIVTNLGFVATVVELHPTSCPTRKTPLRRVEVDPKRPRVGTIDVEMENLCMQNFDLKVKIIALWEH